MEEVSSVKYGYMVSGCTIKFGITGNWYCMSSMKNLVVKKCIEIGKSPNSIYYNKKYGVWAFRVKNKTHKRKLMAIKWRLD